MLIRHFSEIAVSSLAHHDEGWSSYRFLSDRDAKGVSIHELWIHPDVLARFDSSPSERMFYCIEGEGDISCDATRTRVRMRPGSFCVLDEGCEYHVCALSKLRLICFFRPHLARAELVDVESVDTSS